MKKKRYHTQGFLLIELLIAFAICSLSVMICSVYFAQLIQQYQYAMTRLDAMHTLQNSFEQCIQKEFDVQELPAGIQLKPLPFSPVLPASFKMPPEIQISYLEASCKGQNPVRLGGCVHVS